MKVLITEEKPKKKTKENKDKSTRFAATLIASVEADNIWSGGETVTGYHGRHNSSSKHRPVFLMVTASEASMDPFVANMRMGRHAFLGDTKKTWGPLGGDDKNVGKRYELLRAGNYRLSQQTNIPEALGQVITTFRARDLFIQDPGLVDTRSSISFITMLPAKKAFGMSVATPKAEQDAILRYIRRSNVLDDTNALGIPALEADSSTIMNWVSVATYFASFLENRTFFPFPPTKDFFFHILLCALRDGAASIPENYVYSDHMKWAKHQAAFTTYGIEDVGFLLPVSCSVTQEELSTLLTESVKSYYKITG